MLRSIHWKLAPKFKRWLLKKFKQISLLDKLNLTLIFSINGVPLCVPVNKGVGYDNAFMTEMWMVEVLKQLLPLKPGVFLDVGANIGQTLLKLRAVSKSVSYLGLEPNPACAAYLGDLLRVNCFDKSVLIPVGLHNSRGLPLGA